MTPPLSPEQRWLAKQVVLRHGANSELLAHRIATNSRTPSVVPSVISQRKILPPAASTLTTRRKTVGKQLEELIDALNDRF